MVSDSQPWGTQPGTQSVHIGQLDVAQGSHRSAPVHSASELQDVGGAEESTVDESAVDESTVVLVSDPVPASVGRLSSPHAAMKTSEGRTMTRTRNTMTAIIQEDPTFPFFRPGRA